VSQDSTPENTEVTIVSTELLEAAAAQSACFVMIVGPEIGRRIALDSREMAIGRSSRADLQLDIESASRHHATVVRTSAGWLLRDNGSTNGTFVNDRQIKEQVLEDGDRVRIGQAILKFLMGNNVETQYHEEIYRLMTLDGLTQVNNKRYFEEALEREFARSKRYKHPFALVLFDIDHFKKVNDTRGHLAGDEILRHLGTLLRANVRTNDLVARIGGEEFAVLLPETDLRGAVAFAEKLRKLVEGERFAYESKAIRITLSFGVVAYHESQRSSDQLVDATDKKLYEAKRDGRNRVCS